MSGFPLIFVSESDFEEEAMKEISLLSFAKINLSIDVKGVMDTGMHEVDMVMQQISFHDDVNICYEENGNSKGSISIELSTNRPYLPTDERNTAYKAAMLMIEKFGDRMPGGVIRIHVTKRIPVAAGMAGGSGNGAAVLHGINALWNLKLSLKELCLIGAEIGSDVPFCVMGQAKANYVLPKYIRKDRLASSCARATGTGTYMEPVKGLNRFLVIAKPSISVSTAQVYKGIDSCEIVERPDNDRLVSDLQNCNFEDLYINFVNVLEKYTLEAYPEVKKLKNIMSEFAAGPVTLMSGSGPTVFTVCNSIDKAKAVSSALRKMRYEAYWTRTTK